MTKRDFLVSIATTFGSIVVIAIYLMLFNNAESAEGRSACMTIIGTGNFTTTDISLCEVETPSGRDCVVMLSRKGTGLWCERK